MMCNDDFTGDFLLKKKIFLIYCCTYKKNYLYKRKIFFIKREKLAMILKFIIPNENEKIIERLIIVY